MPPIVTAANLPIVEAAATHWTGLAGPTPDMCAPDTPTQLTEQAQPMNLGAKMD
jgi:hypothetical protein